MGIEPKIFGYIIFIGLLMSMFVSIFVGKEHAEGIIRNKIIVGHSRTSIYLSKLILSAGASILCEVLYFLVTFLVLTALGGKIIIPIEQFVFACISTIIVIITYSSIYNFVSMLCSESTISVILNVILFVIIFICTATISQTATSSKYVTSKQTYENNVIITQEIPNPNYKGDRIVNMARAIYLFLPNGQASLIAVTDTDITIAKYENKSEEEIEEIVTKEIGTLKTVIVNALISIGIINLVGVLLFSKKELK